MKRITRRVKVKDSQDDVNLLNLLNVIKITQLTDPESILAGWANVHGHTGIFHEAPIFAVAIGLNSHG